ncbi:MAG TPA: hypothetical protein VHI78_04915 [Bacteroidales bacterium]|jgi:hypothetical protein|nr:hypothetical protein [Bacteroidales bacterium]
MKTKFLFFAMALMLCLNYLTFSQDIEKAKNEPVITWYGIDFTKAKFTLVTEDPSVIVNQYLKAINQLVQMEPEKFDLKKWFNKTETSVDLAKVTEQNSKINPETIVSNEAQTITQDDVKGVVAKYKNSGKSGLGLLFVAENLNKAQETGSYYVVFFNQDNGQIVDSRRFEVKASGIGFRNYWASTVYNIMKIWLKSK